MKISKNQFCDILQHIGYLQEQSKRINDILRDPLYDSVQNDFIDGYGISNPRLEQDIVDLLEAMFDDKDHLISYYVFELDCGVTWRPGAVLDENGKDIPLRCGTDLYNLINGE